MNVPDYLLDARESHGILYSSIRGYKYQLRRSYVVKTRVRPNADRIITNHRRAFARLTRDGHLTIFEGYCWDGPSGPTIDTPNWMRASLVHDALYQFMRLGLLGQKWRKPADLEMRRILREDGMRRFRANYSYRAVRWFAGWAARPVGGRA